MQADVVSLNVDYYYDDDDDVVHVVVDMDVDDVDV